MAVCGQCGTRDDKVESDDKGMCGKCHADNWVEWTDFFIDKEIANYIKKASKTSGLSVPELAWRAFDSERFFNISQERRNRKAIRKIFTEMII